MRSSTRVLREGLAVFTVARGRRRLRHGAPASPPLPRRATAAAADPATVRATDAFTLGREAALAGDFECARLYFGEAIAAVRPAGGPAPSGSRLDFSFEL